MYEGRLHNMKSSIATKVNDYIAKQAAVFIKLRLMQVAT